MDDRVGSWQGGEFFEYDDNSRSGVSIDVLPLNHLSHIPTIVSVHQANLRYCLQQTAPM